MSNKRIISCAITGSIHTPTLSEYLPWKPEDIARQAIDAANAGAASVHIHARNPANGAPSAELGVYREIVEKIRAESDVLLCITTGGGVGMSIEQRAATVPEFKPDLSSMNAGSINFGIFPLAKMLKETKFDWEKPYVESTQDFVFSNTFKAMEGICLIMKESGTKPELEIYDIGQLYNVKYLLERGVLEEPIFLQFVTGILGGIGGTVYDLMNLHQTADRIFGKGNYNWSVLSAGRMEFPICTTALFLGGNVRVGMEDNLFLAKGVPAKSNAELVEKMVRIMREFDFEPATPREAREILKLKR
ncbi:MAG TPA: 3-keto-5-aminohexanoate cleavage protein [Deltaproteobacteria bacterium]|nr:3-keto-5-aminohexanoate cleavage protein [Deltaproteobacteria bacterium]